MTDFSSSGRWMAVGHSDHSDARRAGEQAAGSALRHAGAEPLGLLAFDCAARRGVAGFHNQRLVVLALA
jgi:hypothetical protein